MWEMAPRWRWPNGDAWWLEAKKQKGRLCSWTNKLLYENICSGHSCSPCSHSVADIPLWYDAISGVLAVQTSQWARTLDLDDQRAVNLPTTTHPHVATYGTYCTHKHKMTHPCVRQEPPRSLCERYQYSSIYIASVPPDPTLTSPLLPCPRVLILFGMCCQAMDSVNTAPGNSDRKPP